VTRKKNIGMEIKNRELRKPSAHSRKEEDTKA
jgi:hypothetical protein